MSDIRKFMARRYKALELAENALANSEAREILREYFQTYPARESSDVGMVQAKSEAKENSKGSFTKVISDICESYGSNEFTPKDLIAEYEKRGNKFTAKDKVIAVNSVPRRIIGKKVRLVHKGSGQQPSRYVCIHRFPFPREMAIVAKETA